MTTTQLPPSVRAQRGDDARASHPKRCVIVAVIVFVVLALVAIVVVLFTPVLGTRSVRVTGLPAAPSTVQPLRSADVLRAADVAPGTPLARLDTAAVTRRVEALPLVAAVRVSRSWPSTVTLDVTPRTAVGYLVVGTGGARLIDGTGRQYLTVAHAPAQLPRFAVADGAAGQAAGRALARVAASLPADVLTRVRQISAFDPGAITLVLRGGRLVQWGSAADSAAKARVLPTLLRLSGTQLDVSDPSQPFLH